jgi:hypothetical protein
MILCAFDIVSFSPVRKRAKSLSFEGCQNKHCLKNAEWLVDARITGWNKTRGNDQRSQLGRCLYQEPSGLIHVDQQQVDRHGWGSGVESQEER